MSIHPDQRHELAAGLRALREDTGVSTRQLATRLGWSQSKVTRIDRGKTLPKPREVDDWTHALSASTDERRRLVGLAEQAGIQLTEWKREVAPGRRKLQAEIGAMELAASVVRLFGMDVIPGLAQTGPYAETMFRLCQHQVPDEDDIAAVVDARLSRQAVLNNPDKTFKLLCTETAFRRNLLNRNAMLDQVQRVLEVAALPNVEFGVIPFSAREHTHTYHAFAVIGDPTHDDSAIVLVETLTRGLTIRADEEVTTYIDHFNHLAQTAITNNHLPAFLQEVTANSPWS
jgi:transcriptional regulator with XRE-family HTH domain